MANYDHSRIEKKWQKKWLEEKTYEPDLHSAKKPFYNLMMFPYPSAEGLHVGNMYAFTGSDIYGRYQRMNGNDVFEPIGLDGFGIHSENYAMKVGTHPAEQVKVSEKRFYEQLQKIGNGFAWDEHLETYDPEYYRWTQWLFVQMWKNGLAYRKKQAVNWCPKDLTVLADEQVENEKCERCGTVVEKRDLEQWFFGITKYADRLLKNLDTLDWSEKVKVAQKNWIGKSEGALIGFKIQDSRFKIDVFTTRPDTLFGATYLVLAPEHEFLLNPESRILNRKEVETYVAAAKKKKDDERVNEKEKTGVELKGVVAINPATNEEIPIWVADYVLGSYGTAAIMAVPAHDERDFAFAKKYNLPIKSVIAPYFATRDGKDAIRSDKPVVKRSTIYALLKNKSGDKYLCLDWEKFNWHSGIIGGIEAGENPIDAAIREIKEETGYQNIELVAEIPGEIHSSYFAAHKDENRYAIGHGLVFQISDENNKKEVSEEDIKNHKPVWIPAEKMESWLNLPPFLYIWKTLSIPNNCFTEYGILINSGKFDGMDSEAAKWEIVKMVGGERKIQFRLRDWLISRQRYWGPPIPMVFCDACAKANQGERADMPGWYSVPEDELPVKLPMVKDFRPQGTGTSPLANVKEFYETKCPHCGGAARRETDVSDTFLDSAWYYLRYLSPDDDAVAFDLERVKNWLPVATYIGGAEHSVLHLLYVRFVAMALHDWKMLPFEEPIKKFRAHGLVIKDGAKMSKSKGNVINPDEYVTNFGADTLRTYLMFMAPFEDGGDFRDEAILGIERFLKRVWQRAETGDWKLETGKEKNALLHKTIKKVGEDISSLHYNTAISAMMILLRNMEEKGATKEDFEIFIKLLAPFAPHITEEIWRETLGHPDSIHRSAWPEFDASIIKEETVTLVVQVNSKTRDMISAAADLSEADATALAMESEKVKIVLNGQPPKKVIYVKGRLVNIVI